MLIEDERAGDGAFAALVSAFHGRARVSWAKQPGWPEALVAARTPHVVIANPGSRCGLSARLEEDLHHRGSAIVRLPILPADLVTAVTAALARAHPVSSPVERVIEAWFGPQWRHPYAIAAWLWGMDLKEIADADGCQRWRSCWSHITRSMKALQLNLAVARAQLLHHVLLLASHPSSTDTVASKVMRPEVRRWV